jgi:hypothetical protein
MEPEYVRRVGKTTIVSLLDISVDPFYQLFQLQTGQVVNGLMTDPRAAAYEPQRLIVSGRVLLAIYELIEQHVDNLRRIVEEEDAAHSVK